MVLLSALCLFFASLSAAALPATIASLFRCSPQDATCAALGELYAATGGPNWLRQRGWADAALVLHSSADEPEAWPSYCAFEGVSCNARGAVTRLCVTHFLCLLRIVLTRCFSLSSELADNGLAGSVSASLDSLTELTWLCVAPLLAHSLPCLILLRTGIWARIRSSLERSLTTASSWNLEGVSSSPLTTQTRPALHLDARQLQAPTTPTTFR